MNQTLTHSRRFLSRFIGWFFAANILLLLLGSLGYLTVLPHFTEFPLVTIKGIFLAWIFTLFAFITQAGFFCFLAGLISLILIWIFPRRFVAFGITIFLSSALLILLIIDCIVYYKYHFHIEGILWDMLCKGVFIQFFDLSKNELNTFAILIGILMLVFMAMEWLLAKWIWCKLCKAKPKIHGGLIAAGYSAASFLSYVLFINAGFNVHGLDDVSRSNDHLIVMTARVIPYYTKILGVFLPKKTGNEKLLTLDNGYYSQNQQLNVPVQYPIHPLQIKNSKHPYNIVIIAIDTWRFDMLNKMVSPHMANFAKLCWNFHNHYSGGNSTQPGIFSLFYSVPPTYWSAMLAQKRGPVFIRELQNQHYQMGVFTSADLSYPPFDQTVFREVKNLEIDTPGDSSAQRDQNITQKFKTFILTHNQKQPFFSFLFYDEVHNWCGSSQPYKTPFQPAIKVCDRILLNAQTDPKPYLNRYKNAVYFVDQLIGKDLALLKKQNLLKNTIVIITADHGEEFNEEHLNLWGHASGYDPYQVKIPFLVYWPGQKPKSVDYQTSHYDVVPTLMTQVLGCKNPVQDYSFGQLLKSFRNRNFLIIGSYVDYAVLQNHHIITVYPGGDYGIAFANGHQDSKWSLDLPNLVKILKDINRFFQR